MLGALAVTAAGFLFAAPAAQAHSVVMPNPDSSSCTRVTTSSKWPGNGYYYDCGDQAALDTKSYTLPSHLKTKFQNENVWVILWKSAIEMDAAMGTSHQGDYRLYGTTFEAFPGGNKYIIINLFERVRGHDTCTASQFCVVTSSELQNAWHHEVGHGLDEAYGNPSHNSNFQNYVDDAWDTVNGYAESNVFPNGVPPKKNTPGTTTWSTYTIPPTSDSERNEKILKELYPNYLASNNTAKEELFAFAYQQYKGGLAGFDWVNPYGPEYNQVNPHPNTTKLLDMEDWLKRMQDLTKIGGTPKSYFHEIWTNSSFTP